MKSFIEFLEESFTLIPKKHFKVGEDGVIKHVANISGHSIKVSFNPTIIDSKPTHIVGFEVAGNLSRGNVKNPNVANEIKNHIKNVVMSHVQHTGINRIWYMPSDHNKNDEKRKSIVYARALKGLNAVIFRSGAGNVATFKKIPKNSPISLIGRMKRLIGK